MIKNNKIKIFIGIAVLLIAVSSFVYANEKEQVKNGSILGPTSTNRSFKAFINKNNIGTNFDLSIIPNEMKLSFASGTLNNETEIQANILSLDIKSISNFKRVSKLYQFDVINKVGFNTKSPIKIEITINQKSDSLKQIYFYDKSSSTWKALPLLPSGKKNTAVGLISLPFAQLAVFENPKILTVGTASWYKYKNGNFAASPNFAKGTKLRVYNALNNKFVDVVVNDYGPNREYHPERVVDLDKVAFSKIASASEGLARIYIEPLGNYKTINWKSLRNKSGKESLISSKSAIVIDEATGKVLWQKDSFDVLPLASLTKIVAMKVFMDTNPDLKRVVKYSIEDEKNNYKYVDNKWEVARLKVRDGETMILRDLLYSALVGSANNAVESLARETGLKREEFIKRMNAFVRSIGASSTSFKEPTGLSVENVSSVRDYAIITREVFKSAIIEKVSITNEYIFKTINTKNEHKIKNTNTILRERSQAKKKTDYPYDITGTKTGFLYEASHCLMMRARTKDGRRVIAVTFGSPDKYSSTRETDALILYGLDYAIK